jgi:hypothetical protein
MNLVTEISAELDGVAPGLVASADWTAIVHDCVSGIAPRYAAARGWTIGWSAEISGEECMTLEVYQTGGKPGQFLFDQCWLRFHHTNSNDICFAETNQEQHGCLIGCELAFESEWHDLSWDDKRRVAFHRDFWKLVVSNAETKLFVFRCADDMYQQALVELRTQIISAERKDPGEVYLISCFRTDLKRVRPLRTQVLANPTPPTTDPRSARRIQQSHRRRALRWPGCTRAPSRQSWRPQQKSAFRLPHVSYE